MSAPVLPLVLTFLFFVFETANAYVESGSDYYGYQTLSGAAIAAIILGCILGILLCVGFAYYLIKIINKNNRERKERYRLEAMRLPRHHRAARPTQNPDPRAVPRY